MLGDFIINARLAEEFRLFQSLSFLNVHAFDHVRGCGVDLLGRVTATALQTCRHYRLT